MRLLETTAIALGLVFNAPALAQPAPQTVVAANVPAPSVDEIRSATQHTAVIAGKRTAYAAVAGTLTVRDNDGKPTASMFYVAYLTDQKNTRRPVTFFYNGGPGSSTIWLHMASFGPRRVAIHAPNPGPNAPHRIIDNDDSLLPKTDIVFLDAINTGYSRPLGDAKPESFYSADSDLDAFAGAITRFLTLYGRWNSPKFLFGESYGSARSAGLVNRLQNSGIQMNGMIQLGSILDIAKIVARSDRSHIVELPTFAVTAAYHGKIVRPVDEKAFIREVTTWGEGPFAQALAKGHALPAAEKAEIARQMAAYTGLSERFILENDLRVEPTQFRSELLRDRRQIIGELDTRFVGDMGDPRVAYDPSATGVFPAITAGFHEYMDNELKFKIGLDYRRATSAFGRFDFRRIGGQFGNYRDDLANAMKVNPNLKVYSLNGIYDLSTVFYGADYDYLHMRIPENTKKNLSFAYYPSGHMAYVDQPSLEAMTRDIGRFYDEAAR